MSYIKLDFNAYKHNLEFLAKFTGDISKIMAVLKDNAYGHGIEEISEFACKCGIKRVVVKNNDEALKLYKKFDQTLVLSETDLSNCIVDEKIAYSANSIEQIMLFKKNTNIHLKVDTGMGRNGVSISELDNAFKLIKSKNINLQAIFTHFYAADMVGSDFFVQEKTFLKVKKICQSLAKKYGFSSLLFHSKNSSALLRGTFNDDFARVGIAGYGYVDMHKSFGEFNLKPILSLWAKKICTRELKKGDSVGYSGLFRSKTNMIVSTYDLGYGDGLFRYNGNGTLKIANGKNILGKMSMDSISIEGDEEEICILNDAKNMANFFDTITYEIITKLSPFIKRELVIN